MDRIDALDAFNRDLLFSYADRCISRVTGRAVESLLPSLSFDRLRENVQKEAQKDRTVFEAADAAHRRGRTCTHEEIDDLFARSKDIDQHFLRAMVLPALEISIQYDDLAEVRKKRFRFLAAFAAELFDAWRNSESYADLVRRLYSAEQFFGIAGEILFLYCVETKKLAASVRFYAPFNRAMDYFIDEVVEAMEEERLPVAAEVRDRYFPHPSAPSPPSRTLGRFFPYARR